VCGPTSFNTTPNPKIYIRNQADEEGNNISIQQHQTPKILKTSFKK
jgi:hypothetical protein